MDVSCGSCGEIFQVDDELAGPSATCPFCGASNDLSTDDLTEIEFKPKISAQELLQEPSQGIPAKWWWLAAFVAVSCSAILAYSMLHSDDWERRHLQELTDADKRADAYYAAGDFRNAGQQYQIILATLNNRTVQSVFLRDLFEHAEQGVQEAQYRLKTATTLPSTAPSPSPTTEPDISDYPQAAVLRFQRRAEALGQFVRSHPILFQDANGNWRRRRFIVWDVDAQIDPESDSSKITLHYTCNSMKTAGHDGREDAQDDPDFLYQEHDQPIHCTTVYEFQSGKWVAGDRQNDLVSSPNDTITSGKRAPAFLSDLSDLYQLEDQAFSSR